MPTFRRNILPPSSGQDKMKAIYSSETLVTNYKIIWCQNTEDHIPHFERHENLKYQRPIVFQGSRNCCWLTERQTLEYLSVDRITLKLIRQEWVANWIELLRNGAELV
jgi:hypothetical protein